MRWQSYCCFLWHCGPTRAMASSFFRFLDHTQRRTTVGRTPLYEWSARRRDLYLTTHNTHNRQTSMPPVGFEPTISAGERPQTYALDRAATGAGLVLLWVDEIIARNLLSWLNLLITAIDVSSWLFILLYQRSTVTQASNTIPYVYIKPSSWRQRRQRHIHYTGCFRNML